MNRQDFTPKLFSMVKNGISRQQIVKDITAGIIVGIIALPLAIAFAIASGVSPEKGLLTAIIAGFIISACGGSRVQIGGPTGAFVVIVVAIINTYGFEGLVTATFMAGILLIIMGVLRMGQLLRYIPYTLIVGFTTGIALFIFSSQVKDFLGLTFVEQPETFVERWMLYGKHIDTINLWAVGIGIFTIAVTIVMQRIRSKIPGSLIAIVITTLFVRFGQIPVETIVTRFGSISASIPAPHLAPLSLESIIRLFPPALTIALLGALESLLSAVVADGMIGGRHRSNMELIAQGFANMASALFGGIPATGAIARTATNVKNGARTPISGIVHALVLLLIMLVAGPLVGLIPLSCLAGILIVAAWNMSEMHAFLGVFRTNIYEILVLLTTFLLTVFKDLTVAVLVGFSLSTLLFIKRISDSMEIVPLMGYRGDREHPVDDDTRRQSETILDDELAATGVPIPDYVTLFEVNGPLFFGTAQEFTNTLTPTHDRHTSVILRMRYVPIIDATGLKRLEELVVLLRHRGISLIISGASSDLSRSILKKGFLQAEDICPHLRDALARAEVLHTQQ